MWVVVHRASKYARSIAGLVSFADSLVSKLQAGLGTMTQTKRGETLTPPQSPETAARIQAKGQVDFITPDTRRLRCVLNTCESWGKKQSAVVCPRCLKVPPNLSPGTLAGSLVTHIIYI